MVKEPEFSRVERHVRQLLSGALDLLNVVDPQGAPISLRDVDVWLAERDRTARAEAWEEGVNDAGGIPGYPYSEEPVNHYEKEST